MERDFIHLNDGDTDPGALLAEQSFFLKRRLERQVSLMGDEAFFSLMKRFGISNNREDGDMTDEDIEGLNWINTKMYDLVVHILTRKASKS